MIEVLIYFIRCQFISMLVLAFIGHQGAVQGVVSDGLNQIVISGGIDASIKFWRFKSCASLAALSLTSGVSQLVLHRENNLLAAALDNFYVDVFDCETRKLIRSFGPHGNRITDMTFNAECRWLITSCMDSTIRVWDLPLGQLVDCFTVGSPCVSLAMSPTGEFLATAHSDSVGIYFWSNVTLYNSIALRPLPANYEPQILDLPCVRIDEIGENEASDEGEQDDVELDNKNMETQSSIELEDVTYKSPEQIEENLITLSELPLSRWRNLLNIDLIKVCN